MEIIALFLFVLSVVVFIRNSERIAKALERIADAQEKTTSLK
jgi:hypothetical protein